MPVQRIFIAVSGMSPQIVTETLFALAQQAEPWYADEIFLISTVEGGSRAEKSLLRDGRMKALCADYGIPLPKFDEDHIRIIKDPQGLSLSDIRSQADNEAAADCMTSLLQEYCLQEHTELHVSMAGGRKTMGFHVGYALSMLGRKQDRLSHVLVSEPYEAIPNFFYPTPYSKVEMTERFGPMDHKDARVTLVEIPFVRLRAHLNQDVIPVAMTYSMLVRKIEDILNQTSAGIVFEEGDFKAGTYVINGLSNMQKAVYYWILDRRQRRLEPLCFSTREDSNLNRKFGRELHLCYQKVCGNEFKEDARILERRLLDKGVSMEEVAEHVSHINKMLRKYLGIGGAEPYALRNEGKKGVERIYTTGLEPSRILLR